MNSLKFVLAFAIGCALFGCGSTEQTTENDLKAATAGQKPDPAAADVSSPMGGMKKGGTK